MQLPCATSAAMPGEGGASGASTGAAQGAVGGGTGGTGGGGSSSSAYGSTGNVTPWNVTADQTVEGRVAGILSGNSPVIQQARATAKQAMNDRGLINSSLATTAGELAAYQAALPIAQADAATYAKAAGYNADQSNQFSTNALNRQSAYDIAKLNSNTSRELATMSAETQKQVATLSGRFSQLSTVTGGAVNLSSQFTSALNAIFANTSMDTAARDAAVAQLTTQYENALTLIGQINDPTAANSPTSFINGVLG